MGIIFPKTTPNTLRISCGFRKICPNMKRKIEAKILQFINQTKSREAGSGKKCLLIDGLRQVGKTYTIRKVCGFPEEDFAISWVRTNFEELGEAACVYLALDKNPDIAKIIDEGCSAENLLKSIGLLPELIGKDLKPSKSNRIVLLLDEIQVAKRGVNLLKCLASIEGLTVIASGSMLGILKNADGDFPIGYVEILRMFPMDFGEFLLAHGYDEGAILTLVEFAREGKAIPEATHKELSLLFKHYVLIGGLPEYVKKYIGLNYDKRSLYSDALTRLEEYRGDIAKYSDIKTKIRGIEVFDSVFSSLSRPSKRYFYSDIKKGAKGKEYKHPLNWVINCGMAYKIHNVKNPEVPLSFFKDEDEFKLYYPDNILLYAKLGPSLYEIVMDDLPSVVKGIVYENICAEILYPMTSGNLYYYSRKSGLEIDFVIEAGLKPCFVEIKSSENTKSKSLSTVMNDFPNSIGVRCSYKNNAKNESLFSLPLYMLPFIDKIV